MKVSFRWAACLVVLCAGGAAFGGGCGSSSGGSGFGDGSKDGGDDGDGGGPSLFGDGGSGDGGINADPSQLAITPATATLNVTAGTPAPTQTFTVTYKGNPINASFVIPDNGALGTVSSPAGVFTPSETVGGTATITANYDNATVSAKVTVVLTATENGDPSPATKGQDAGAGGYGGVGGDGPGGAVTDTTILDTTAPTADTSLSWLYPYDQTVFPQGILAPLLMWNVGSAGDYDSIKISLGETNYKWTGYFAKSAAATGAFQNAPIPAAVWTALYTSNLGNEAVTVNITLAKGTTTYALPARTWKIAGGLLQGTVYYQAYNTQLVKNSNFTVAGGGQVGAATLAIKGGSTAPTLVAGTDSGTDGSGCRVCHVVSSDGSTLVTQRNNNGDYFQSEKYTLGNLAAGESALGADLGIFAWAALSPDGSLALGNVGGGLPGAVDSSGKSGAPTASALYNIASAATVASTGLPADLQASTPSFSPDGKHVAFNYWAGGGVGDQKSLGIADFDGTSAFTNATSLAYTPPNGQVIFPSFLPTSSALVFSVMSGSWGWTTGTSNLWWYDRTSNQAAELKNINGDAYLPGGPNGHDAASDAMLNFEPTVDPIASGGYAWVVFTSRRLYGNVATLQSNSADPRTVPADLTSPTPKKLWIAAVDLNGTGGTDPSHPAFYLPAQELLGGNSRGYWANDACLADGTSCQTGNQCCGGYCTSTAGGPLTCGTQASGCSAEYDKCNIDTDCCDSASGISCINHVCTVSSPR